MRVHASRLYLAVRLSPTPVNCGQVVAGGEGCSSTARGTNHRVLQITADVGENWHSGCRGFIFQRPLLLGAVNLAQVVNTGVLLGGSTRLDEVWNRDRG